MSAAKNNDVMSRVRCLPVIASRGVHFNDTFLNSAPQKATVLPDYIDYVKKLCESWQLVQMHVMRRCSATVSIGMEFVALKWNFFGYRSAPWMESETGDLRKIWAQRIQRKTRHRVFH